VKLLVNTKGHNLVINHDAAESERLIPTPRSSSRAARTVASGTAADGRHHRRRLRTLNHRPISARPWCCHNSPWCGQTVRRRFPKWRDELVRLLHPCSLTHSGAVRRMCDGKDFFGLNCIGLMNKLRPLIRLNRYGRGVDFRHGSNDMYFTSHGERRGGMKTFVDCGSPGQRMAR
jgi:hypothetical protein